MTVPAAPRPRRSRVREKLIEGALALAALVAASSIVLLLGFVVVQALPVLFDPDVGADRLFGGTRWEPGATPPAYSVLPLVAGTLRVTAVALLVSVPVAVLAALYVAREASPAVREVLKPTIELLASVPSVLLGFLAVTVLSGVLQRAFGLSFRLNALVAGLALGVAVVPVVFTIAEDALRAVPRELSDAALALGARRWQVHLRVVLPSALPGIAAAVVLGAGRAVSETMIVLMAAGNAPLADLLDPTTGAETITAAIASELGEASRGGPEWRVLFLLGLLLFLTSWSLYLVGHGVASRLASRLAGEGAPS